MNLYHYLFYKFTEDWGLWPEARVFTLIVMLDLAILGSLLNYYTIFTGIFIDLPDHKIWIYLLVIMIVIANYLILLRGNKKNKIIKHFDNISQKKNDLGGVIVLGGVLILVVVYILSFFMLDSVR